MPSRKKVRFTPEELAAVGAVVGRIAVGLVGREEEPITGIGADDEEGGTWLGV